MPILLHKDLKKKGELGLWAIEEEESWFLSQLDLSQEEQSQLDKIQGHRRVEWLAARMLIHRMSGREKRGIFWKDEFGKPHLENSNFQISISHSRKIAAAIAAPSKVGVDIQQFVSKIDRLTHKFLSKKETQNLDLNFRLWHLHVYWGAKEALYKAYGRRQLDFCKHILIQPFKFQKQGGIFTGRIQKGNLVEKYELAYQFVEDYALVYAIGE